jgi:hypothetical protein
VFATVGNVTADLTATSVVARRHVAEDDQASNIKVTKPAS